LDIYVEESMTYKRVRKSDNKLKGKEVKIQMLFNDNNYRHSGNYPLTAFFSVLMAILIRRDVLMKKEACKDKIGIKLCRYKQTRVNSTHLHEMAS